MLIVRKRTLPKMNVQPASAERIESFGFRAHSIPERNALPSVLPATRPSSDPGTFDEMLGVQEVIRVSKPYKLVSRDVKEQDMFVRFANSDATVGGEEVAVMA